MKSAASNLPNYDVTELVQFEEQPDGSMTVEPRCPGWPECRCSPWATPSDPHGAFGPPGMMGG